MEVRVNVESRQVGREEKLLVIIDDGKRLKDWVVADYGESSVRMEDEVSSFIPVVYPEGVEDR